MADPEDPRRHLLALLKKFDTAVLVSHTRDGGWHARPMAIASVEDSGDLYFSTSLASPKVGELETDPGAMVTLQSSDRFAAVQGTAEILRERSEIDRLWSESWRVWFPGGKTDPSLCLIRLRPKHAEYWDRRGLKGLSFAFEAARAAAKGKTPEIGEDKNAKVEF
jgi:general stress protein 26